MAFVAACLVGRVLLAHLPSAPTIVLRKALAQKEHAFAMLAIPVTIVQVSRACMIAVEMAGVRMAFVSASLHTLVSPQSFREFESMSFAHYFCRGIRN
jgi:hypothetical protein